MTCPFCKSDLIDEGAWGQLALHQSGEVFGHVYKCPNHEGFDSEELAEEFLEREGRTLEDLGVSSWDEVTCDSAMHSVSGSFYTDQSGDLQNGYPC